MKELKILGLLISLMMMLILVGCGEQEESLLPPKDNETVTLRTQDIIKDQQVIL